MSANEEIAKFEDVAGKATPRKTSQPRPPASPSKTSQVSKVRRTEEEIEAEIRAKIEAEYAERLEAKIRAEMEEKLSAPSPASNNFNFTPEEEFPEETPVMHVQAGPGEVVIHFVDDGATHESRVMVRGDELALNPEEHPWVNETRAQQIRKRGKHLWAKGPWPYGGFDLTDPELTREDKLRLLAIARRGQQK